MTKLRMHRKWFGIALFLLFGATSAPSAQDAAHPYAIGGVLTGTVGGINVSAPITRSLSAHFPDRGMMTFVMGAARQDEIAKLEAQVDGPRFRAIGYSFFYDRDCDGVAWFREACAQYADEEAPYRLLQFHIAARAPGSGMTLDLFGRERALAKANGGQFTEHGVTYYPADILGHDAITSCRANTAPDVFDWRFLCNTSFLVGEQAFFRGTHYLNENFDPERDWDDLYAQLGEIAGALMD